jgi:chromosome segregation ATPase
VGSTEGAQTFALLPLVDKIAYAFAGGLVVAMRELEGHIACETQKVSENVNRRLDSLQASFHELAGALSEQRSLSVAVQEKCTELEAATVALAQTDERQEADLNGLRNDAASLTASVAERFDAGDDATHHAAHYASDRVPTAHLKATESATGHTQQDVAHRML